MKFFTQIKSLSLHALKFNLKTKLTTLFLVASMFTIQANSNNNQNIKITLNLNKVTVEKVLDEIEARTEYKFLYNTKDIDVQKVVSINVVNKKVEIVLNQLFKNTNKVYEIADKHIILKTAPAPLTQKQQQQPVEVTGTVKDTNGMLLPGANIIIKNSSTGVLTNFDGVFNITVPNKQTVLVISHVGMLPQEIVVGNQTNLDITLEASVENMNEVVITALGMKREKKALGYSVGEINTEKINLVPQENVLGGMSAKISGVDIRRGGNDLNNETFVYIRGKTSLTGNDQPLVVIDGSPIGDTNVMGDISAMDIENISVLKGASAAALYGSRAGNGVILITTKSGKSPKRGIGVSFNTTTTFNTPYKFFDLQNRFTNGKKGQFDEATWQHWYGAEKGTSAVQWNTNGEEKPLNFYDNSLKDYFKTGITKINDVSVSGAYDKGDFRLSLSHLKGEGYSPGTELNKIGFNLATTFKITDKVKLSTNINLSNPKSDNYPVKSIGGNDQYFDIYNIAPHINVNDLKGNYWEVKNAQQNKVTEGYNNPWFSAHERKNKFDKTRGFGNIKLDWKITPDFNAMARVSHSSNTNKTEIIKPWSYDGFGSSKPKGSYNISNSTSRESNIDVLFSYKKKINNFHIAPSVGANLMNQNGYSINSGGDNLVLPGLYTLSNVSRGGLSYESASYKKAIYSVYGLVSLSYKDYAFVDITARNDWSSTLPKENRSYFYPSVSTSVLFSEFIDMPEWVSLVKLRSSWAQVGKDTSPYMISPTLSQGYWGDDFTYSLPTSMPNTNLKPEIATSYEIGTDLKLFHGRLGFDATYYKTQNKNQILNVDVSPLAGYTSTTINAGNVENYGIELGVNAIPVKFKDFEWSINANFTKQQSKLVELVDGIDRVSFGGGTDMGAFTRVGGIIGDLYSPYIKKVEEGEYKGWNILDSNGRWEVDRNKENQIKVGNFNNDFTVGFNTAVTYKNFTLSTSFDWRQGGEFFSESMKRMARSGKIENWKNGISSSTFSGVLNANSFNGDRDALAEEIKNNPRYRDNDVWVGGRNQALGGFEYNGNHNGAFFPGVIDNGDGTYTENFGGADTKFFDAYRVVESSGSFWRTGYAFMYDASFVKMRDITLTYKFSKDIANYISAQNVSLSVYAKNVMLWTAAGIGIDPELAHDNGNQGFEKWNLAPWSIPMGFRLNVTF
ncbi:TonB-linked SusC/RagA family outer membrane protein [Wenyingzhuangia heitensis]|uniref:TonB-linked SusC/RagA family outer membrane protein n=1 Tax=Wenyingzhuangia heitensis TaxID=1487859 RepID=A0ABX0U9M9_9FLAO|nr:SusC/RagA family TonB-linked outer membrane protein [Wenyingzhuangia heitensis]NIJ45538.1 TonB-linked SusC/RagA family outer membrane protein [Wenyingzhuangia heitensis]